MQTVRIEGASDAPGEALSLWYREPANKWVEALPLGNGRLAAMVFGGIAHERLALNEATLWSGSPIGRRAPDAAHVMPELREAVLNGDGDRADELVVQQQGPFTEAYLPAGDLIITLDDAPASVQSYRRDLDLTRAVATTTYQANGARYTRESFVSAPDQVIVTRLTCDQPGKLSVRIAMQTQLGFARASVDGDTLTFQAKAPATSPPNYTKQADVYADDVDGEGMNLAAHVRVIARGGAVRAEADGLAVRGADSITILLSLATSYNGPDRSPGLDGKDPVALAFRDLDAAARRSYDDLLARHVTDYQSRFSRVSIDLGAATSGAAPTSDRVVCWRTDRDPQLAAVLYQYGRYLLISCSREDGMAANLQGLWNEKMNPPWSCNFTTNINTEMNYWPAETTNLADSHEALIAMLQRLALSGADTARRAYGADGWVLHHNTDLWLTTWAVGSGKGQPVWSNWPMGAAWLVTHAWEHYAFDPDEDYLRDVAYPLMKGASQFALHLLVEDASGYLVTIPSTSPETDHRRADRSIQTVTAGATMDLALLRVLFGRTIDAARRLGIEDEFVQRLTTARSRLLPYQISPDGTLAEWANPAFKAVDARHRHVSHLVGLFPLDDVDESMGAIRDAIKRTLDERGDDSTGWSLAWKLNLWARLRDGEHAYRLIDYILRPVGFGGESDKTGGVYPNLLGAHPPFQIDGNFGYTSGLTEMLLQSHANEVDLLPALPRAWRTGHVIGLRARGGFEVDLHWHDGTLTRAVIRCNRGGRTTLRYRDTRTTLELSPGQRVTVGPHLSPL